MKQNDQGHGPEFKALVADLRALVERRRRAEAKKAGDAVIAKAVALQREGKLSATDVARLHALHLRLENSL